MPRVLRTAVAACSATVALAAAGTPAAAASENPCAPEPNAPECVNYGFDQAEWAVDTARAIYNDEVQARIDEAICDVYDLVADCRQ